MSYSGRLKDEQIKRVLSLGKYRFDQFFTIKWLENKEPENRFVIIVSKKVDNRAVTRNKIRRVLREYLRNHKNFFYNGFDVIVILKPKAKLLSSKELRESFKKILFKTTITKNEISNSKNN